MISNRRSFLRRLGAAGAAVVALPQRLRAHPGVQELPAPSVPPAGEVLPEEFWAELRTQFLMPRDEAFFNTGTLGSSPRVVLDAVIQHMTHVDRDIAHWDYKAGHEQYFTGYNPEEPVRAKLATLINAEPAEVA